MKIAIHHREGSFSEGWLVYCKENNIPYKLVNAYDSDIISQIDDCDAFMWHFSHLDYRDILFAKQLLYSIELSGKKVFPNYKTVWHFDDKVGQKYLFEALNVPLVPSYSFYDKSSALSWIEITEFPKVFKLRGGAGASNVQLVKTISDAKHLINKAFGNGFSTFNSRSFLKDRFHEFCKGNISIISFAKSVIRCIIKPSYLKFIPKEKGYVYFQDFIPNNTTDTRIVVVGDKIIGERRGVRENDFRASGSHILLPDASKVDIRCVKLAYNICQRAGFQIGVFDFVHKDNNPLVVEVSYGTLPDYTECEGYWTPDFQFIPSSINLPQMIIESFLNTAN